MRSIRNDVVLGTSVKRTNGHHAGGPRRQLPGNKGLQCKHNLTAQYDRVPTTVGMRTVCAHSMNDDVDCISAGIRAAFGNIDLSRNIVRIYVKRECVVRLAKPVPDTISFHRSCAQAAFLGGLHNEHQRATPLIYA